MQEYVTGFAFSEGYEKIYLIKKNRPDFQKGKLNGIGGKIEENELPIDAMVREFREETGIHTSKPEWKWLSYTGSADHGIWIFTIQLDRNKIPLTVTDEEIIRVNVSDLNNSEYVLMDKVPFYIAQALAFHANKHREEFGAISNG